MNQETDALTERDTSDVKPVETGDAQHVLTYRNRMLAWPNPVEFVNNMYGCHPGDEEDYFGNIFGE
jgi:hypothetical protein